MNDRKGTTWNFLVAWHEYDSALTSAVSLNEDELAKNPNLHQQLYSQNAGTIGSLISSPEARSHLAMKLALAELSRS